MNNWIQELTPNQQDAVTVAMLVAIAIVAYSLVLFAMKYGNRENGVSED